MESRGEDHALTNLSSRLLSWEALNKNTLRPLMTDGICRCVGKGQPRSHSVCATSKHSEPGTLAVEHSKAVPALVPDSENSRKPCKRTASISKSWSGRTAACADNQKQARSKASLKARRSCGSGTRPSRRNTSPVLVVVGPGGRGAQEETGAVSASQALPCRQGWRGGVGSGEERRDKLWVVNTAQEIPNIGGLRTQAARAHWGRNPTSTDRKTCRTRPCCCGNREEEEI